MNRTGPQHFSVTGSFTIHPAATMARQSASTPRARWDPRILLDLEPDHRSFTCSGTTKRGLRCRQSMISGSDLREASAILDQMGRTRPRDGIPLELLEELAYLTLCPRWHRKPGYSQVDDLASKWKRMIYQHSETTASTPVARPTRRSRANELDGRSTLLLMDNSLDRESRTALIRTEPRAQQPRSQWPVMLQSASQQRRSATSARQASQSSGLQERSAPRAPPRLLIELPDWSSSQAVAASSTPATSPSETTSTTTRVANSPAASQRHQATPVVTPSTTTTMPSSTSTSPVDPQQLPTPPASPTQSENFPRRKPLSDSCPVCLSSFAPTPTSTASATAVYCRAQCGTNIHRTCFNEWRKQCLVTFKRQEQIGEFDHLRPEDIEKRRDRCVKCLFCRAVWKWEWED
jgi:hypothetical protein